MEFYRGFTGFYRGCIEFCNCFIMVLYGFIGFSRGFIGFIGLVVALLYRGFIEV